MDSIEQVIAGGMGASNLYNSPLLPEQSPSSLSFMYPTHIMNIPYVPGLMLVA